MSTSPAARADVVRPAPTPHVPVRAAIRDAGEHVERGRLRSLGARIGEAVRAAHSAAVPF